VTHFSLVERWRDSHPGVQFQAQPAVRSIPDAADDVLCKYFLNTGQCALGDACPYRHEHGTPAAVKWVSDRVAARRVLSGNRYAGDEELMHVKAHRAEVFASWLVATFGLDALCGGSGVLDIAGGGSGGLSFALHVLHGVPVTTVDPRPVCLTTLQRKRAAEKGVRISPRFPDQLQVWFDDSTWHLSTGRSMLVGMHPDQATDAIVDCALQAGIPFAVVPCCVFPSLMAASRGARLRSREQLIAYLVNKRPGEIMVEWLPFDGASQVLFWRGPQGAASTAMRNLLPPWWDERMTQQC
jgi:Zinc finger C-x8-C-x5-C-x3-H type (and similar)